MLDKPQTIVSIWKNSFSLYSRALIKLLPFTLTLVVLETLLKFEENLFKYTNQSYVIALALAAGILFFLVNIWIVGVITLQVNSLIQGNNTSYRQSMRFAGEKYFILLLATILSILITLGGIVLLVIPGLIAMIILPFADCFVLFEEAKAWAAIKSSFKLVWGNWWRTLLVVFVPLFLPIIIILLFELLGNFSEDQMSQVDHYIVNPLIGIFIIPFFEVVLVNQYYDLKARKAALEHVE